MRLNERGATLILLSLQIALGLAILIASLWAMSSMEASRAKVEKRYSAEKDAEQYSMMLATTLIQSLMIQARTLPSDPSQVVWLPPDLEPDDIRFSCDPTTYPVTLWCNPADATKKHPSCWCMEKGSGAGPGKVPDRVMVKLCNLKGISPDDLTTAFSANPKLPICNRHVKVTIDFSNTVPVLKPDNTPEYNLRDDGTIDFGSPKKGLIVVSKIEETP